MIDRFFGVAAQGRIEAAVKAAEARSEGQVVAVVVERSDDYPEAALRGALLGALAGGVAALAVDLLWLHVPSPEALLAAAAGGVAGALLARLPALERFLARGPRLERAVEDRALRAFAEHHLERTAHGTGVLVFASLLEHRAVVLGDHGIHARMGEEGWDRAVALLTGGLRRGDPAGGFEAAIAAVGDVLAAHFPAGAVASPNELPDAPRVSRE